MRHTHYPLSARPHGQCNGITEAGHRCTRAIGCMTNHSEYLAHDDDHTPEDIRPTDLNGGAQNRNADVDLRVYALLRDERKATKARQRALKVYGAITTPRGCLAPNPQPNGGNHYCGGSGGGQGSGHGRLIPAHLPNTQNTRPQNPEQPQRQGNITTQYATVPQRRRFRVPSPNSSGGDYTPLHNAPTSQRQNEQQQQRQEQQGQAQREPHSAPPLQRRGSPDSDGGFYPADTTHSATHQRNSVPAGRTFSFALPNYAQRNASTVIQDPDRPVSPTALSDGNDSDLFDGNAGRSELTPGKFAELRRVLDRGANRQRIAVQAVDAADNMDFELEISSVCE